MLMTRLALSPIPDLAAASRRCWGFTANTTTSFARTASLGLSTLVTPYLSMSLRRAPALISPTRVSCNGKSLRRSPPISASAMLPPPINVILMTGSTSPFSKNRRAHPYQGRAFGDRRLEVRGHAHRERIHREAVAIQPVAQLAQLPESAALQRLVGCRLGHCHETAQLQARQRRHLLGELRRFRRGDAALGRLARHVDLDAHLQLALPGAARLRKPRGDFRTADRGDPAEGLGDRARLVSLDRAQVGPTEHYRRKLRALFDALLAAGLTTMNRGHGHIRRINLPAMEAKDVHGMIYDIMNDGQRKHYEENLECDFSFAIPGLARFRVNAFVQNRGAAAVMRTIPSKILSLEELRTPKIFAEIVDQPRGIVLVTGPTGSGKSTTLAAMVNQINENEQGHILTIEDPIEFVHESKKCLINQREVGPHTLSFANALRSALREDPDIILVGEMRDLETIRLALTGAETGHLVFGTLHTSSAAKTIDRIVDVFPAAEKEMIRAMISESIRAIISQTLCKTKDGAGRVAAHEIMVGNPAIRNLIRENKIAQMYSAIQTGRQLGMQTLDQNLQELVQRNMVAMAEARSRAANKDNFAG